MSTGESERDDAEPERYASLELSSDEFVIYDLENHQAWIQSPLSYSLTEIR